MKIIILGLFICTITISCTENPRAKKEVTTELIQLNSPATDSCAEPFLFTNESGKIYLSWIQKIGKESELKFSILENNSWSTPKRIAAGNNWFVNWADYPVIVADTSNNLIAHYLEKSDPSTFSYDVKYVTSSDNGESWSDVRILHDDGKKAEHGFVSMIPYKGKIFASWLDGRNTVSGEKGDQHGHHGQMTIRAAMLTKDGTKENEWELDNKVCDCCQTTTAITNNGPIVVYRDRSDSEIRDMSIVRFVNEAWTKPQIIFHDEWKITGCPVNGPSADAIGNNLAIAWFSMKDKKGQVKVIFSSDGGATFSNPIQIDEGNSVGRVDLVMLDEKSAMVSWMEGSSIKAVRIHSDGQKENSIMIAESSESRSSGFPQMTKSGNDLIFAWTDDKARSIKVAKLVMQTKRL